MTMRTLLLLLVLLSTRAAIAQPIIESDIEDKPLRLDYVLVVHSMQTTLYGPDKIGTMSGGDFASLTGPWKSNPLWAVPGLLGMGVDMAHYRDQEISANTAVDELAARFDYFGETSRSLDRLSYELDLRATPIYNMPFTSPFDGGWRAEGPAQRAIQSTGASAAAFLHLVYFISPDLLQVRVIAKMKIYKTVEGQTTIHSGRSRHFEYLSAPVDEECRRWVPGYREKVTDRIEETYRDKTARYPHNEAAYSKDRKLALRAIDDPDVMPPAMAFPNCWPKDSLALALQAGIDNIVEMIRMGLAGTEANAPGRREKRTVYGLSLKGMRKKIRGIVVSESGGNTVIQVKGGDLYSVPTDQGRP